MKKSKYSGVNRAPADPDISDSKLDHSDASSVERKHATVMLLYFGTFLTFQLEPDRYGIFKSDTGFDI